MVTVGCSKNAAVQNLTTPPPTVTVAPVLVRTAIEWDEYVGRLEAISTVEIRPRVSGYVQASPFVEGQIVEKGELLFVIDTKPFESSLRRAIAQVASARAELASAQASLAASNAHLGEVEARVRLADDRYLRAQQLARTNAISDEEFQTRLSEQQQAVGEKNTSLADIEVAKSRIASAEASIETAMANQRTAEIDLGYTQVTSPIRGRVGQRLVTPGNLISGGSVGATLLTTVVSLNPIHCYFEADEAAFLKYVRLSNEGKRPSSRETKNPVFMSLADESGFPHKGHMDFVDNRLSRATATIGGRAIFSNSSNDLSPGLFAKVRIPGSGQQEMIFIPDEAVSTDQSSRVVMTIGNDGSVVPKKVDLGPIIDGLRAVRSGLEKSDTIVVNGLQFAFPGSRPTLATTTIVPVEDGLPNTYEPVPQQEWITTKEIIDINGNEKDVSVEKAVPTVETPASPPTQPETVTGGQP